MDAEGGVNTATDSRLILTRSPHTVSETGSQRGTIRDGRSRHRPEPALEDRPTTGLSRDWWTLAMDLLPPLTGYQLGEVRLRDNLSRMSRAIGQLLEARLRPGRPRWPALAGDTRNEKL